MHYTSRVNKEYIERSFLRPCVTAILGPRRVGKTCFIQHYAEQHPDRRWVFLNMDHMDQCMRVQSGELKALMDEEAKAVIGEGEKHWVVIDEAQKCPAIFDQIKALYDQYKETDVVKFILTGSAVLSLHQFSAESLAGRVELHPFHAFTLRESTRYYYPDIPEDTPLALLDDPARMEKAIAHLAPFKPVLEEQLTHQLLWGGFPELLTCSTQEEKILYLRSYLQTYLEKDVRSIETITDMQLYRNLMEIIAEQTGSVRYDARIVEALQCKRDTVKKYRGYLEATLLFQELYPYINGSLKRLVKSPKGYLLNNGLISVLTGLADQNVLEKSGLIGHRVENWFLNELNVLAARTSLPARIYYWRTSTGAEVDFVWVKKPHIYPIEITYSDKPRAKKIKNLVACMALHPAIQWGYYVYTGPFDVDTKRKIIFIPCWAIA